MYAGLGISMVPASSGARPSLEQMATEETAWRECRALEPILGPCQMAPPAWMSTIQVLDPVTATARFPWPAVAVLSLLAFLALKGGR